MALPRIAPEELERLKNGVSIKDLAEGRGIKLKPQGKDLVGLCPFRKEETASLHITPAKNLWHCFGCDEGGTVIDWVMKTEGVSFRHAVEILKEGVIPQGEVSGKIPKTTTVPKLSSPISLNAEDRELMLQVVDYYHATLKKNPDALSYLEKRGLKNSEMLDHFKLGYANRTLGLRLPYGNRQSGAAIREQLRKIGIYRENGREHFWGAIVFPIFDENGHVTEIYGRKTGNKLLLSEHVYLPGPHKGVFNDKAFQASKEIILCEAIIDALTFWCAGFRNVTASYGVHGFTSDHLEAFKKYGVEKVYIAYDRDKAGDSAADELSKKLIGEGFECFRVLFPHNMDANEYAQRVGPPEKSLDLVIRNAVWLGKGKREIINIPETGGRPEEPTAATKEENILEEPQSQETRGGLPLSQPLKETKDIFPLDAKESLEQPPKPAPEPLRPDEPKAKTPEPARNAPVREPVKIPAEIREEEVIIRLDDRRWRIRGLAKNMSYDQLKVNLLVSLGDQFHVDTFDLYSARCRAVFVKQTCEELRLKEEIVKLDLGRVLRKVEELQDEQIKAALEPKEKEVVLTPEEEAEALEFLKDPRILRRILSDFEKCGIVGEETNKLVGYLAAVSRKLEKPLGIIIQSSSSAGKTLLMESVLAFMPDEERIKYSAMTGQSLFYMGEKNLKHKILAIVEEEGAERASYALKLLQSEGELSIASTGKDPRTGRLVTHEYKVQGPVMIFVTTTNVDIDEELQNRCIMLSVDESREQTRAIHQMQRESRTLEGFLKRSEKPKLLKLHQNAQRLLKAIPVLNMYSRFLTFMDDKTRLRRDQEKYLNLIEALTLIHQYQRPLKTIERGGKTGGGQPLQCLEVNLDDIELANRLAHEVLGRSLDELPPQTRRFLLLLDEMVKKECEEKKMERGEYRFFRSDLICERPPAKAGGFVLRLKAGLIGHSADCFAPTPRSCRPGPMVAGF
jgi:DNA primase catalytic core